MLMFSKSSYGFYDTSIHRAVPVDAVKVSEAEHISLLEGQNQGGVIDVGDDGHPFIRMLFPLIGLEDLKLSLKSQIDDAAEIERLKYITPGNGQAMTYQQKVAEAQAFKAATSPKAPDYPILSSEVGITAETLAKVADIVLTAFAQWQQIGAMIESIRLGAKRDVDAAVDEAAARAVVDVIIWP